MSEPPVAFLTGEYPRATDTFIQREVAGLRAQGLTVLTCSIRRTDPGQHVSDLQRAEAAATFHVLEAAKSPLRLARAHLGWIARAPGRWLRALGLAARTAPPGLRGGLWQLFYFLEAGVLAERLRASGAGWLHHHFADSSGSVALLAAEIAGLPRSFTLHGPAEFYAPEKWRLDVKIARARFVACISHFARAQCMLFSDRGDWGKLRIVHCGVEPAAYAPQPGRPPGKRMVFVGRLAPEKGLPVLLEAFASVRARHAEAELALIGDGPSRPEIEAQIARGGVGGAVEILGFLPPEAVAAELSRADLLVLPSFAEGLPVVLMEALATGIPAVATRIAAVEELVEPGVCGLTVAPGDAAGLAEAMDRLLGDPALRARMGEAGRARVVAEFDVARETAWLAALIRGGREGRLPEGLRPGG
ncbi:glycosyltransferase [Albimonas pacifica]|uniref:Glycosyltransferase involved in cell wall bisynthesis n=1 Tax=Albimonas pacifica TaxID=1114924 RepID=A0A1I3IKF2_9RHOB|nr:glycosyltransferase [Albimonas pacifica]SFI48478.1 Glycosyltransferase involved in cell wall bisynthesis [Albimonas pacifica]